MTSLLNNQAYLESFETARKARNEPEVPLERIAEALAKFEAGSLQLVCYPNGVPTLKSLYDAAAALHHASAVQH